ncbi:MAG: hypothetical protein AB7G93_14355 [Bdellovibrionales bacterium]
MAGARSPYTMSYHYFYKKLDQQARHLFPSLDELGEIAWEHLVSPLELTLPVQVRERATRAIQALYRVSRSETYSSLLEPVAPVSERKIRHNSVLMAYDFHTTMDGRCYLVEVNTNASGYMLCSLMERAHADNAADDIKPLADLASSFREELRLSGRPTNNLAVAITDDDIPDQKMYPEFLMYRDWFQTQGWNAALCEARDLRLVGERLQTPTGMALELVYNRLTDFYLEDSEHSGLREAATRELACITPHPREYWLLADKQRLIQLTQPGFLERAGASAEDLAAIREVLLPTFEKTDFESEDEIWSQRKSLFFKPKRSHGGKSVYRGESVSRRVFERLMKEDILIQKYQPAQKIPIEDPRSVLSNWKFDLRFYVYADRVQLVAARIYQGQVTNFSSAMGGFTLVRF